MPTKLSHLLYRLFGRDPPDRWVDRSMMTQQNQPQTQLSWSQSFLAPSAAAKTSNNASTATVRGGGGTAKAALPAKIKVRAENERQLEVKIGTFSFFVCSFV